MTFANIPDRSDEFKRFNYTKIYTGCQLRLRILDQHAVQTFRHYIPSAKMSIICLGVERCPICQNNLKLVAENPKLNARQIRGYIPRQNRYMVNVLNRTMVKKTSKGNIIYAIHNQFSPQDPETGELLTEIEPEPLNEVQVLERGPRLFEQFNQINETVIDNETGNPIGLWKYDIVITSTGSGRKMITNVTPYPDSNDVVDIPVEEKAILESLGVLLEPDEIVQLLRGISLRDIYQARQGADNAADAVLEEANETVVKQVDKIFDTAY